MPNRRWIPAWLMLLPLGGLLAWCPQLRAQQPRVDLKLPEGIRRAQDPRRRGPFVSDKDGMPMVLVPAGKFLMGSSDGSLDERPAHEVYLDAFLIDVHEVTNAQFEQFVQASRYQPQGPWRRGFGSGQEGFPVRLVTWFDAKAYARWAGRNLPSEAMWEKAARGESGHSYPWGPAWKAGLARTNLQVSAGPTNVGSFGPGASPYGCLDMAGNVWEWVNDWYDRQYYQDAPADQPWQNPSGPQDGTPPRKIFRDSQTAGGNERSTRKVIRGGGWVKHGRENSRCSKRTAGNPRYWMNDTGFRCAIVLSAPQE